QLDVSPAYGAKCKQSEQQGKPASKARPCIPRAHNGGAQVAVHNPADCYRKRQPVADPTRANVLYHCHDEQRQHRQQIENLRRHPSCLCTLQAHMELLTDVHRAATFVPKAPTMAIAATTIRPRIRAYSITSPPCSFLSSWASTRLGRIANPPRDKARARTR